MEPLVDLSHNNGRVDFAQLKANGKVGVMNKALEGVTAVDQMYYQNMAACDQIGLARGPYHFIRPEDDFADQARAFCRVVGTMKKGHIKPAADWEYRPGSDGMAVWRDLTIDQRVKGLMDWITTVEGEMAHEDGVQVEAMIYTSKSFWQACMGNTTLFRKKQLWLAHYGPTIEPIDWLFGGWTNYTIWQKTGFGKEQGVIGDVDEDQLNGVLSDITL